MAKLTEAEMERLYDSQRSGAIYTKVEKDALTPEWFERHIAEDEDRIIERVLLEEQARRAALRAARAADENDIADEVDRILADIRLAATADDAPTMRETVEMLFAADQLPSGDQIFDLVLEDAVAHYAWIRCIDWVLWRQSHGKPVKVLGDPDRTSAAIDARYDAARVLSSNIDNYRAATTDADMHLLCAGAMIEKWERTPEQEAKLKEETDLMIAILEAIDGGE